MSAPLPVRPLPDIPGLPVELLLLAKNVIADPRATSDHLLVLADALDELRTDPRLTAPVAVAARLLADGLRHMAPAYA